MSILQLPLGLRRGGVPVCTVKKEPQKRKQVPQRPAHPSFCDSSRWKPASSAQTPASLSTQETSRHVRAGRRDAAPQQQDPALAKPHNRHKNPQRSPSLLFCSFAALKQKLIPLKKLSERKSRTKEAAPLAGSLNKTAGRAATLQLGCIG